MRYQYYKIYSKIHQITVDKKARRKANDNDKILQDVEKKEDIQRKKWTLAFPRSFEKKSDLHFFLGKQIVVFKKINSFTRREL